MKLSAKVLMLGLVAGTVLFAGCNRRVPVRGRPQDTLPQTGLGNGNALGPNELGTFGNEPGLEERGPGVIEDANTIRGLLQPVYFEYDRASIKESERPKLQAAADYLKQHPEMRLLLEGHCDWRGTAEYNLGLGDRRAAGARKFLIDLGVSTTAMETLSKGDTDAIEKGTDEQMAHDRRVDIVILKPKDAAAAAPVTAAPANP